MVLPFVGGWALAHAAGQAPITAIFVGAAMTATSIGITARVLSELGVLATREGQIILGAAVVDDVLGLVVLAVVSQIAEKGGVDTGAALRAAVFSIGFLAVALAVGIPLGEASGQGRGRARVRGVLVAAAVAFALLMAWAAQAAGSAPIVGAFAAGVALARTNRRHDIDAAAEARGGHLRARLLRFRWSAGGRPLPRSHRRENRPGLLLALVLTIIGFLGKFLAGFCAWGGVRRAFIGAGMVPRGEVGLIFASLGLADWRPPDRLFSSPS